MEIVPFRTIGPLSYGDSRQVARDKLASPYSVFAKDIGSEETDSFDELGLHLYYDAGGNLELVEGFEPANITFHGVGLIGRDLTSVVAEIGQIGFDSVESDVGVKFPTLGIALTASDGIVEGVAAHRKGYYES
jgi:hypothetical protein